MYDTAGETPAPGSIPQGQISMVLGETGINGESNDYYIDGVCDPIFGEYLRIPWWTSGMTGMGPDYAGSDYSNVAAVEDIIDKSEKLRQSGSDLNKIKKEQLRIVRNRCKYEGLDDWVSVLDNDFDLKYRNDICDKAIKEWQDYLDATLSSYEDLPLHINVETPLAVMILKKRLEENR